MTNDQTTDNFFERVWDVVAEIPMGKVTTYGHIAAYLGNRRGARTVGWAMRAAGGKGLPCHRVVNQRGELSGSNRFETPDVMRERLEGEGIVFLEDGRIDMKKHLWIPEKSD